MMSSLPDETAPPELEPRRLLREEYVKKWRSHTWWGYELLALMHLSLEAEKNGSRVRLLRLVRLDWDRRSNEVTEVWVRMPSGGRVAWLVIIFMLRVSSSSCSSFVCLLAQVLSVFHDSFISRIRFHFGSVTIDLDCGSGACWKF